MSPPAPIDRRGLAAATGAFVLWGVVPLYWHLLKSVPSLQIIAHRVAWGALMVFAWLAWKQGRGWLRETLARPRMGTLLALSAVLIGFNWGLYIWAVNAGHVVETSLGYFINPLISVVFGVAFLRERLRPLQWAALGVALLGVLWLTFNYGHPPWIALALAVSFALYGLIRKVAVVDAVPGLGVESAVLFVPALLVIAWAEARGTGGFLGDWGLASSLLLVIGGAITALPLVGFAYGVRRIPLSLIGLLQYIAPTLQLLVGVLVLGEAFGPERAIGFGAIWLALALYVGEGLLHARRSPAPAAPSIDTVPPEDAAIASDACDEAGAAPATRWARAAPRP